MRKELKSKRALEQIQKYLEAAGHNTSAVKEVIEKAPTDHDAIHLQVEGVLLYLEKPARFITKPCKECGEYFGTNYRGVSYCSNAHRAKALADQTGIRWNPHKSEVERWGGEPPLIIPPAAVSRLREFAEQLLAQLPAEDTAQVIQVQEGVDEVIRQSTPDSHTSVPSLPVRLNETLDLDLSFLDPSL